MDRQEIIKVVSASINSSLLSTTAQALCILDALTSAGLTIEQDWKPIDDGAKSGHPMILALHNYNRPVLGYWNAAANQWWAIGYGSVLIADTIFAYRPWPAKPASLPEIKP